MNEKVLIVDDDPHVLAACERQLRKSFAIETALGGAPGLRALAERGPFAVVVADMQMPEMDGIEFLGEVRRRAPDTVRMMLTGNADQRTAVDAINEGHIFRFLNKPCLPRTLRQALEAGLKQYQLVTAERELLERTLGGSLQVLTDILSIVAPLLFHSARRTRGYMRALARALQIEEVWELEAAAMLSQIGIVTLPTSVVTKARAGQILSRDEEDMLERVPQIGRDLLMQIPRLGSLAQTIYYQEKRFDGTGFPRDSLHGVDIPLGARLLKLSMDLTRLESSGKSREEAFRAMALRRGWYDPDLLVEARSILGSGPISTEAESPAKRLVSVRDLRVGMVLKSAVESVDGKLILQAGRRISPVLLQRIRNFSRLVEIREPVHVEARAEPVAGAPGR